MSATVSGVNAVNLPAVALDKSLYPLVDELMAVEGKKRFFEDWKKEISARLNERRLEFERKRRAGNTEEFRINFRNGPQSMTVVPRILPPTTVRRVNYRKLRETRPDLYSQFVKTEPPKVPARLTFKAAEYGKNNIWNDLRSIGWIAANEAHEQSRAATGRDAELIGKTSDFATMYANKRIEMRLELLDLLVPDLGDLTRIARDNGVIVPSLNPPKESVDMDVARSHPELSEFVSTSTRVDSVSWRTLNEREAWERLPEDNRDSWAD